MVLDSSVPVVLLSGPPSFLTGSVLGRGTAKHCITCTLTLPAMASIDVVDQGQGNAADQEVEGLAGLLRGEPKFAYPRWMVDELAWRLHRSL